MEAFLRTIEAHPTGLLLLGVIVWFTVFMLYMLRRLVSPQPAHAVRTDLWYVVGQLFLKVINDFRHLLALLIFTLFSLTMLVVLLDELRQGPQRDLADALQAVMATFGGLLGSVIGYYFGEAKGGGSEEPSPLLSEWSEPEELMQDEVIEPIAPAGLDELLPSAEEPAHE